MLALGRNRYQSHKSHLCKSFGKLIRSDTSYPVVEIGTLKAVGSPEHRHRVILIANGAHRSISSPAPRKSWVCFTRSKCTSVVPVNEPKVEVSSGTNENGKVCSCQYQNLSTIPIGKWYGSRSENRFHYGPNNLWKTVNRPPHRKSCLELFVMDYASVCGQVIRSCNRTDSRQARAKKVKSSNSATRLSDPDESQNRKQKQIGRWRVHYKSCCRQP